MSKKKRNISSESETKEIEAVTDIAEEDEDSIFYDNTAGTIFAADSDAETGSNKAAQKTAKKREKQKENGGKPSENRKPVIAIIVTLIVAGLLIGLYFWANNAVPDSSDETKATYPTDENGNQYATDLKGNKIDSQKDKDGNIIIAGVEELINHVPADIKSVNVTNEEGSFELLSETPTEKSTDSDGKETVTTSETKYTLKGYEDAPLASGMPDAVANDAAAVTTTNIVDITGKNPQDYGLDKPRSTVKVTSTNNNARTITVGNDAPDNKGTYIMVDGDKAIYLVDSESVDSFLYKPLSLLSKEVTSSSEADGGANPKKAKISGSKFKEAMEFVTNDDKTVSGAYFKMTAPVSCFVNVTNGSKVLGSLRSVSADDVLAYKPDDETLKKYGIDTENPYAEISAEFSDTKIHLYGAKPVLNNNENSSTADTSAQVSSVYVYNPESKMIYSVSSAKAEWALTSYEDMVFEYVMRPDLPYISNIEVTASGKTYSFDVNHEKNTDSEGNETSSTTFKYGDKSIDSEKFDVFYQNLESAMVNTVKSGKVEGNAELTVKISYTNDKQPDTYTFYKGDTGKYNFSADGSNILGDVFDTYVNKIIEDTPKIAKGETVNPM